MPIAKSYSPRSTRPGRNSISVEPLEASSQLPRDIFTLALSGGIAGMLLFQMIVNVGMVLGVMPITGLPLPFVTYGGASLLSAALGLGILESLAMSRSRSG